LTSADLIIIHGFVHSYTMTHFLTTHKSVTDATRMWSTAVLCNQVCPRFINPCIHEPGDGWGPGECATCPGLHLGVYIDSVDPVNSLPDAVVQGTW